MRYVLALFGISTVMIAGGCPGRNNVLPPGPGPGPAASADTPTVEQLVKYMDGNSQRVSSLRCEDVDLTVSAQGQGTVNLMGHMACQRGRKFRLMGSVIGKQEVDLGSNDQEFWYWIRRSDPPYQVYCSYQALSEGKVRQLPFPFQPDWVLETMGMGNYGPASRYKLETEPERFKLVEIVRGPQGRDVKKVIVFTRRPVRGNSPVITDYLLLDAATNQEICSARISEIHGDATNGTVPRRLELSWPEQKMKLGMRLSRVQLNQAVPAGVFARVPMQGVQSFDLATGRPDPTGTALQRVRGKP